MAQKIVINRCFGGYSLSREAYEYLGLEWDKYGYAFENDRSNPKLVECIEKLGEKVNGELAELKVIEIPDGVEWQIGEYDGREWVSEKHRIWS